MDVARLKSKPACRFCHQKWPAPPGRPHAESDSDSDCSSSTQQQVRFAREDEKDSAIFDKVLQKHLGAGQGFDDALALATKEWDGMRKKAQEEQNLPPCAMDDDTYHRLLGRRKHIQQVADRATTAYRRKLDAMERAKQKLDAALEDVAKLEMQVDQQDQLRAQKKQPPVARSLQAEIPTHQTLLQHELLDSALLQGLGETEAAEVRSLQANLRARAEARKNEEEARQALLRKEQEEADETLAKLQAYKKETHKDTDTKKNRTDQAQPAAEATASDGDSYISADSSGTDQAARPKTAKAQAHAAATVRHKQREQEIQAQGLQEARTRLEKQGQCS